MFVALLWLLGLSLILFLKFAHQSLFTSFIWLFTFPNLNIQYYFRISFYSNYNNMKALVCSFVYKLPESRITLFFLFFLVCHYIATNIRCLVYSLCPAGKHDRQDWEQHGPIGGFCWKGCSRHQKGSQIPAGGTKGKLRGFVIEMFTLKEILVPPDVYLAAIQPFGSSQLFRAEDERRHLSQLFSTLHLTPH